MQAEHGSSGLAIDDSLRNGEDSVPRLLATVTIYSSVRTLALVRVLRSASLLVP